LLRLNHILKVLVNSEIVHMDLRAQFAGFSDLADTLTGISTDEFAEPFQKAFLNGATSSITVGALARA